MMTSENVAMSTQEERLDGSTDRPRGDFSIASNKLINGNLDLDTSVANLIHGGVHAEDACPNESDDQLARIVMELTLQNDYLKGQLKGMKPAVFGSFDLGKPESQNKDAKSSETIGELQEKIKSLNKEIQQHRETQKAAEDALEHLRAENSEADGKVQELF
ncbi:hypothetical protein HPP92_026658 [Vanilla planifolia]|uniref:Uncharacterized protein n=1 Tax=Vanilla planifolia TaxID=51239 RepID=A0A835PEC0_VANPL|nr:hypothetical protein HPP92_026658 [Vanilla planifolia]